MLEGPTWTFFWVRDGRLHTPPLTDGILDSITRGRLLEELDVAEAPCTLDDVRAAEEAFIASSVREVMPIAAVDDDRAAARARARHERGARGVQAACRARAGCSGRCRVSAARAARAAGLPVQVPEQMPGGADHAVYRAAHPRDEHERPIPRNSAITSAF